MSDDETQERTYGIWGLGLLFVALIGVGIYAVIAYGTLDREPTEQITDGADGSSVGETTTTEPPRRTMLDGSEAPPEVEEVVSVSAGEHSYLFTLPDGLLDEPTDSVVAKSAIEISEDRTAITVSMQCAVADGSVPAVLELTEDPFEINVRPIVLGPSFGPPCPPDSVVGVLTVPLEEPVGARRVVLAQAGKSVRLGEID